MGTLDPKLGNSISYLSQPEQRRIGVSDIAYIGKATNQNRTLDRSRSGLSTPSLPAAYWVGLSDHRRLPPLQRKRPFTAPCFAALRSASSPARWPETRSLLEIME